MGTITLACDYCGRPFEKYDGEVRRQIKKGRKLFFCSMSCGAKYNNSIRPGRRILLEKVCPECRKTFQTMSGSKSATFCSASCASKGSMYDHRREAQRKAGLSRKGNLLSVTETLKRREDWKYKKLSRFLLTLAEPHEFEFELKKAVYDRALTGRRILVEFDARYHDAPGQRNVDKTKDAVANSEGWQIVRIRTYPNTVIDPEVLYSIVKPDTGV